MSNFKQQVIDFQRKAELAMRATLRESAQDLTEEALEPKAKGGRMPVDTGALRNSFVAGVNSFPSGPTTPEGLSTDFDLSPLLLAINKVNVGDRLVIGTAMNYAAIQEAKSGFIRLAAQNWVPICEAAAKRVRRAIR